MEWELDLDVLDKNQYKAVTAEERFVRVIAGAGSGKTRTLTYRFAYLVKEKGISPDNILCVTFTKKATNEMKKRFKEDLLGYEPKTVMTFNALGNRILKREIGKYFGWSDDYDILDENTDLFPIIRESLKKYSIKEEVSIDKIADYIVEQKRSEDYLSYIFGDRPTDIDEQINSAVASRAVNRVIYYEYLKKQRSNHQLDFTDQVSMPLFMFERFPDMLEKWSHTFHHILVDEFQDVSDQNYLLCEALAGESNSLFVVGDPDQVIYGWRDAKHDYLINFHKAHPGTSSIQIMTNYRSSKEIIEGANRVIINNTTSHNPELEMTPFHTEEGVKIKYYHAEDSVKEAEFITEQIRDLLEKGIVGNRIAVLYRAHRCKDEIKQQLKQKGINYEEYKEASLPSMPIVKDIIAFMQFAASPTNENLYLLKTSLNYYGVLDIDVEPFLLDEQVSKTGTTEYEAIRQIIKDHPGQYPKSEAFIEAVKTAQKLEKNSTLIDVADYICDAIGITEYLHICFIEEEDQLVDMFRNDIIRFSQQADGEKRIWDFLQEIEDEPCVQDDSAVQLMTIHAAKGLEFEYVFIVQMTFDTMPINATRFEKSGFIIDLEEERRVAYVAFTRAMKELYLTDHQYKIVVENKYPRVKMPEVVGPYIDDDDDDDEDEVDEDYEKPGKDKVPNENDHQGEPIEKKLKIPSHYILEAGLREGYIDQLAEPLSDAEMLTVDDAYKFIEWLVKLRTKAALGDCPLFCEVEHVLYGHGTITGVVPDKGAVKVKFDDIKLELTITDFMNLRFIIPEDRREEAATDELFKDMPPRPDDDPLTQRVKKVLKLINETAADEDHKEQVSVLALPCGTGKSSAISLKICQTIAAYKEGLNEGILIISNNTEQLNRYLTPKDEAACQYINEHYNSKKQLITLMTKDNKKQALKSMRYSPVLILTTQRYFRLDYFELVKRFLTFGKDDNCRRTLIIIDEEPTVYENITVSATELNLIDSSIKKGLTDKYDQEEKDFCIAHWGAWREYLDKMLSEYEQKAIAAGHERQFSYVSDYSKRRAVIETKDETGRIIRTIPREPWAAPENMARFYRDMQDNMHSLTFALSKAEKRNLENNNEQNNVFDLIRALYEMMRHGAIHEFSSESTRHYTNQFSIRVDNRLYFDESLGAKIVILDGTADISPVYDNKELFYRPDCGEFSRQLNNLTLNIYDVTTGKTTLVSDEIRREKTISEIKRIVSEQIPAAEPWAIFTNKDLKKYFKEEFTTATVEHFGNIRGKNEFKDMQYIVQAGMFRCTPSYYFLFELDQNHTLAATLANMSEKGEDTTSIIKEHIDKGYAEECSDRLLMCDIEQNLFRGIIRNAETTTPYTYYLFISFSKYKKLIDELYKRYHDQRGAQVHGYQRQGRDKVKAIESRQTTTETRAQKFIRFHKGKSVNDLYTTEEIKVATDLSASQRVNDYLTEPQVQKILKVDRVKGRRGYYQKRRETDTY